MSKITVAVLVGSLRKESYNRRLAKALEKLLPEGWRFDYLHIDDLPLYNQDFDQDYPAEGTRLKRAVEAADALLVVTPEYNRSFPGVLKNALDIGSRPWGANSFNGKPGAALGASPGAPGTSMAQQHLRNVLLYLGVKLMGVPEAYVQFKEDRIDAEGNILHDDTRKFLQDYVDKFVAWVGQCRKA